MRFSRLGEHTIKCIISEDEIFDMGYTLDEIMSNGERTQEFMNCIFDKAEQEFQMRFDLGIKTVRADFLPDHTLSLTFSEHPTSSGMVEHLKNIVSGMLNSIPEEKWEEIQAKTNENNYNEDDEIRVIAILKFENLDTIIRFANNVSLQEIPYNALYKEHDMFYLVINLSDTSEDEVKRLSMLADEYATDIQVGAEKCAHLEEHGKVILAEKAIESLQEL